MKSKDIAEEINTKHNKWLIAFRLNNLFYYTIWGADSTDGNDNKLWIDDYQRIILLIDCTL